MQSYSEKINLIKNFRGVYDLDTSKGCYSGMLNNKKGCYGNCYAARSAKQYGYNFKKTIFRNFESIEHLNLIRNQIFNIDLPFIRIGVTGDPSENWKHTLYIINLIYGIKPIVLITKHWNILTKSQLNEISKYNLCINTSISALDDIYEINKRLKQYNMLKNYCKSILRVITCDFNENNLKGLFLNEIQKKLLDNDKVIDNVLRADKNNYYVKHGVIKIKKHKFLTTNIYMSKMNKKTYTGKCDNCIDKCGINL